MILVKRLVLAVAAVGLLSPVIVVADPAASGAAGSGGTTPAPPLTAVGTGPAPLAEVRSGVVPPIVARSTAAPVTAAGVVAWAPTGEARTAAARKRTVLRIMPLGDSITAGTSSTYRNGYRVHLSKRLRAAGVPFDFVGSVRSGTGFDTDHEGHGGWTIERIAARLDGWLSANRPNVVLLHVGTNNVSLGQRPAETAAKLSALIDQIRAKVPTAHIFVSKIVDTTVAGEVTRNRGYNKLIPRVVAAKGPRVYLVDQSKVTGLSLFDVHHPNDFGYEKMAYTWYAAMRQRLAPRWKAPTNNPYARTKHVLLTRWDYAARRVDSAYWSRATVIRGGKKAGVWVKDRNQRR